jgi:hypothetical protein
MGLVEAHASISSPCPCLISSFAGDSSALLDSLIEIHQKYLVPLLVALLSNLSTTLPKSHEVCGRGLSDPAQ